MKKAIVTGGSGFIGSWMIQELLNNGYMVTAIIRKQSILIPDIRDRVNIIYKDINLLKAEDFNGARDFDVFINLAWVGVSPEHKNEVLPQINNISMAVNALEVANEIGCKLFISSGTVAEYSLCDDIMNLKSRQSPNDMYGAAKVSTHYFLEVRARQLGQPFIWVVIPSTFGERRKGNNIITNTINMLLRGEKPLFGNLTQMWDFLYVAEVVKAIRLVAEKGKYGRIYGIGSGVYKPLRDYIERIRDIIDPGLPLGIGELPEMSKQTFSSCVNIYDIQKDTGYKPTIGFDEGVKLTIRYLENEKNKEWK